MKMSQLMMMIFRGATQAYGISEAEKSRAVEWALGWEESTVDRQLERPDSSEESEWDQESTWEWAGVYVAIKGAFAGERWVSLEHEGWNWVAESVGAVDEWREASTRVDGPREREANEQRALKCVVWQANEGAGAFWSDHWE